MKPKLQKKQWILFIAGLLAMLTGLGILSFYGIRKIRRELRKRELMRENTVIEIPELHIKAPVLEGVGQDVLRIAAGHFPESGSIGEGNYCVAGHSSAIYKEYFNNLKNAAEGMEIRLSDAQGHSAVYYITETFIVEPNETWVLDDAGDVRITIVTCTDDGSQRRIVVGKPQEAQETQPGA